jgi:hypothetical protein
MSYEILDNSRGNITIRISGKLSYADYLKGQQESAVILRQEGKARCLILLENYRGTEKEGDWGDISFVTEFDKHIEKMAVVGDREWKAAALLFTGQGLRPFPVEFFETAELAKAKTWLAT